MQVLHFPVASSFTEKYRMCALTFTKRKKMFVLYRHDASTKSTCCLNNNCEIHLLLSTGWPSLGNFCLLGYFWMPIVTFRSSPDKWQHFGLLFAYENSLHFQLNVQFQSMVCFRHFKVLKVNSSLDFQIKLWWRYFGLATVLATFSKILVIFFQSSGHPAFQLFNGNTKNTRDLCYTTFN